jgi:hypothetical protein
MAKAKKRRNSQKKAQKREQKKVVVAQEAHDEVTEAVEADVFEPEETPAQPEKRSDLRMIILIALAGMVLVAVSIIIWDTLNTPPVPSETPRPTAAIPLEGSANPEQLQSGGAPVQNGGGVDGSDNSASDALQPQDSLTPQQQEDLLR